MIEILVKSAIVLLVGGLAAGAMARTNPSKGHLVWTLVFLGAALIPLLKLSGTARVVIPITVAQSQTKAVSRKAEPIKAATPQVVSSPVGSVTPQPSYLPSNESILWAIWGIGALVVISRYAIGWIAIDRIRRVDSSPIQPDSLPVDPRELAGRIGITQNWELRQRNTPDSVTAMTWGILRPVVMLPNDANQWTTERLEAVLLHEFAHVRRRDFASQLLAEIVCALYWFNPLAWLGARAMREVAESAADDAVVRSGVKASEYATQLLQLAAELGKRPRAYAQIGVSAMSQSNIENRLRSVLAPSIERRGFTTIQVIVTSMLMLSSVVTLASLKVQEANGKRSVKEQTEALSRIKAISVAINLYAGDYDDLMPYAQTTETAKSVLLPYTKTEKNFESPTPGGKFEFNLNCGGVMLADIAKPNATPLWIERLGKNPSMPAVGYADSHARIADSKEQMKAVDEALAWKLKRRAYSGPLPKNYQWRIGH